MEPRILITAFEPYDQWRENASWLALVEFTKMMPSDARIVTRRYPVDFDQVRQRLEQDLAQGFDFALHLGQAPGSTRLQLEAIGLNVGSSLDQPDSHRVLVEDGPVAYRSPLPLDAWSEALRQAGIPAATSYHAGTYLCNATLYLTHYLAEKRGWPLQAAFLHLPLDTSQVVEAARPMASLPSSLAAKGLHLVVELLVKQTQRRGRELA